MLTRTIEPNAALLFTWPNGRLVYWVLHFLPIPLLSMIGGCLLLLGPAEEPIAGQVRDTATGQPLDGISVSVQILSEGFELGQADGATNDVGEFLIRVPTIAEGPGTDEVQITILSGGCESNFALDMQEDLTFVDLPFPQGFLFRINEPILVPPCEIESGGAP